MRGFGVSDDQSCHIFQILKRGQLVIHHSAAWNLIFSVPPLRYRRGPWLPWWDMHNKCWPMVQSCISSRAVCLGNLGTGALQWGTLHRSQYPLRYFANTEIRFDFLWSMFIFFLESVLQASRFYHAESVSKITTRKIASINYWMSKFRRWASTHAQVQIHGSLLCLFPPDPEFGDRASWWVESFNCLNSNLIYHMHGWVAKRGSWMQQNAGIVAMYISQSLLPIRSPDRCTPYSSHSSPAEPCSKYCPT